MKTYKIKITGVGDQLQNRLSRDLIYEIKEIARSKMDEWEEANYLKKLNRRIINGKSEVIQPEFAVHAMIITACMKLKKSPPKEIGRTWTSYVKSSVIISEPAVISYDEIIPFGTMVNGNPSAKGKSSKVYKVRPLIRGWSTEITLIDLNDMMNKQVVTDIIDTAGKFVGLSDWRPQYGRFKIDRVVEVD